MIKNLKNTQKASDGITLIALVITIIVLLILAGISISMLAGDNGILQKATTAKENTTNSQITEKIQLAYHAALTGGQGSYTKDTLMDELKKEFETDYDVDDSDNKNWKMKAQGQEVIIPAGKKDNSKVTIKTLNTNTNLKGVPDLSTYYGETTDYTSVDNVQWQLFYDDDGYIYLIASDYVPINTLPSELNKEAQSDGEIKYQAGFATWDENSSNYIGTIMENMPWNDGTVSNTITGNAQTNTYLKWVNSSLVSRTNNPNMKAVAYMMDTTKWSDFAGSVTGAYAIGGPTVEMFSLSFNAKHFNIGTYETIIDASTDSRNGNATQYGYNTYPNTLDKTATDAGGNMWIRTSYADTAAYWLASPSSNDPGRMIIVEWDGYLSSSYIDYYYGFRPLVSIPKSSLK